MWTHSERRNFPMNRVMVQQRQSESQSPKQDLPIHPAKRNHHRFLSKEQHLYSRCFCIVYSKNGRRQKHESNWQKETKASNFIYFSLYIHAKLVESKLHFSDDALKRKRGEKRNEKKTEEELTRHDDEIKWKADPSVNVQEEAEFEQCFDFVFRFRVLSMQKELSQTVSVFSSFLFFFHIFVVLCSSCPFKLIGISNESWFSRNGAKLQRNGSRKGWNFKRKSDWWRDCWKLRTSDNAATSTCYSW